MGSGSSTPQQTSSPPTQPNPPPSPTLKEPWRNIPWGDKASLQYVREYKPENDDIKYLRILLYGPVGAGKSSFINSVSTVVRRKICIPALVSANNAVQSFTKKYQTHKIRKEKGKQKEFYSFVFNDVMGLEEGAVSGAHAEDIKLALRGHVMEGHKFNPVSSLSEGDPGYNPCPSPDDKVHVLVCVLSANTPDIDKSVLEKMVAIREAASDLGIPQMAMITNIDAASAEIEKDLKNVYLSKYVKKKMEEFSVAVGIPMNCIFPVKNYSHEIDLHDDVNDLILSALRKMIDFGDDFIDDM